MSIDCGRGFARGVKGKANVRARDAKDGKSDDVDGDFEVVGVGVLSLSGSVGGGGDGVLGGGGCDSDDSHASFAAFSSWIDRGSNSLRMSLAGGAFGGGVGDSDLKSHWPSEAGSGSVTGRSSVVGGFPSFHGLGDAGL